MQVEVDHHPTEISRLIVASYGHPPYPRSLVLVHMAPNKNAGKAAAKAAKKAKQAEKAAKKEAQAIEASSKSKGKGKAAVLEDEDEDLDAILERYQAEMRAVRRECRWLDVGADGRSLPCL